MPPHPLQPSPLLPPSQRRGAAHDTLAILTSDHAAADKGHCYSGATRTPLLLQWPKALPSGVRAYSLVSSLDIAPTLLDAAERGVAAVGGSAAGGGGGGGAGAGGGASGVQQAGGTGASLLPLLGTAAASKPLHTPLHSHVLCEMGHTRSVLTADYRYLFAPPQPGGKGKKSTFGAAERHPAYYAEEQMYDARADPAEKLELIVVAACPEWWLSWRRRGHGCHGLIGLHRKAWGYPLHS